MLRNLLVIGLAFCAGPAQGITLVRHKENRHHLKKIFFINLDASGDREGSIRGHLQGFSDKHPDVVERWRATTGDEARGVDLNEWSNGGIQSYLYEQQSDEGIYNTVATFLSHARAIKQIADDTNKHNVYFVVEDDAQFNGAPEEVIPTIMKDINKLPKDWDIYHFGFWGSGGCGNGSPLEGHEDSICHVHTSSHDQMGNMGYALNPKGAKAVLAHLKGKEVCDVDGDMMPDDGNGPKTFSPTSSFMSHGGFGTMRYKGKSEWDTLQTLGAGAWAAPAAAAAGIFATPEVAAPVGWDQAFGYAWPGFGLKSHVRESSHDEMIRIHQVLKKKKKLDRTPTAFKRDLGKSKKPIQVDERIPEQKAI